MDLDDGALLVRRDGTEIAIEDSAAPLRDRDGTKTGVVLVFHDVTATRAMTQQMAHSAHHDALTDLPNRLLLNDRLSLAIESARRHQRLRGTAYGRSHPQVPAQARVPGTSRAAKRYPPQGVRARSATPVARLR